MAKLDEAIAIAATDPSTGEIDSARAQEAQNFLSSCRRCSFQWTSQGDLELLFETKLPPEREREDLLTGTFKAYLSQSGFTDHQLGYEPQYRGWQEKNALDENDVLRLRTGITAYNLTDSPYDQDTIPRFEEATREFLRDIRVLSNQKTPAGQEFEEFKGRFNANQTLNWRQTEDKLQESIFRQAEVLKADTLARIEALHPSKGKPKAK